MRRRLDETVLRRCIRAAVLVPLVFWFGVVVLDDPNASVFLSFGAMAHLVFGDYGGSPRRRELAYLSTTVAGAVIIAVATLLSGSTVGAAVGTAIGTFLIAFAGVLGDIPTEVCRPLTLAFVLAVAVPGTAADVGPRVAAWVVAGLLSLAAAFLLPRPPSPRTLRTAIAVACRALADAIDSGGAPAACDKVQPAADRARMAQNRRSTAELEPVRDAQALALMVEELTVGCILLDEWRAAPPDRPCLDTEGELLRAATTVLRDAAVAVDRDEPDCVDLRPLDAARHANRVAIEEWVVDSARHDAADAVVTGIEATRPSRALAYGAFGIGARAVVITGGRLPDTWVDTPPPVSSFHTGDARRRRLQMVERNLSLSSSRFRMSLRQGLSLGIALGVVGALSLTHGFWAALAAFAVLRSNALGTGRAVAEALLGTLAGFVIAAVFLTAIGDHHLVLWILLVPLAFAITGAPDVLGFGWGQALFTVFVVVLFDIISLEGVRIGEARVVDVLVGCAVAAVVGLVTWPHGARRNLQRILARAYAAAGGSLVATGDPARTVQTWLARTHDVFAEYQMEAGVKEPPIEVWASLVGGLQLVRPLADRVNHLPAGASTELPAAVDAVHRHGHEVSGLFAGVGHLLADGSTVAVPPAWPPGAELADDGAFATETRQHLALSVMWADDALADLARVGRTATGPAERVWAVSTGAGGSA